MLNLQRIIFNLIFDLRCFERMKSIYLLCVCFVEFCILAKQRIDSGFFLFQAAKKKKKEKKKTDDGYEESQGKHDVIR